MLSTAATVALVVAGTGASTLWFLQVLGRRAQAPFRPALNQAATGSLKASVPATAEQRA